MKGDIEMKRFVCSLLVLCLIPVCAFCDGLESVLLDFGVAAKVCGAPELPGSFSRTEKPTFDMLEYRISDKLITGFMEKNGEISGGYVVCLDPALQGDFLALSATHVLCMCGTSEGVGAYPYILDMFLDARQGRETTEKVVGNMMFSIYAMKTGIAFNYSIIR